jgi:hypothetical protein
LFIYNPGLLGGQVFKLIDSVFENLLSAKTQGFIELAIGGQVFKLIDSVFENLLSAKTQGFIELAIGG